MFQFHLLIYRLGSKKKPTKKNTAWPDTSEGKSKLEMFNQQN